MTDARIAELVPTEGYLGYVGIYTAAGLSVKISIDSIDCARELSFVRVKGCSTASGVADIRPDAGRRGRGLARYTGVGRAGFGRGGTRFLDLRHICSSNPSNPSHGSKHPAIFYPTLERRLRYFRPHCRHMTSRKGVRERLSRTPFHTAQLTKPISHQLLGAVSVHTMGWKVWKVRVDPSLVLGSNLGYAVAVGLLAL